MGYAKYHEDIEDRYFEDGLQRLNEPIGTGDAEAQWRDLKQTKSAAVAACQDGRFFEERMVFLSSSKIRFTLQTFPDTAGAEASFRYDSGGEEKLVPDKSGRLCLPTSGGDGKLITVCGDYRKDYRISFLKQLRPESLPEVFSALSAIAENPARWTSQSFAGTRQKLMDILGAAAVPPDFEAGVVEFHLGLFHETQGESNYVKRFERAFALLRPFSEYSDYAALICAYYFFRVNAFEFVEPLKHFRYLSRVAAFFQQDFDVEAVPSRAESKESANVSLPILMAERDFYCIGAVGHFLDGEYAQTASMLQKAKAAAPAAPDPQGDERVRLVEARLHRVTGEKGRAKECYAMLKSSPQPLFHKEAGEFLDALSERTAA